MNPLQRLLLRSWIRSLVLVHVGALLLLALVVATESADDPAALLLSRLRVDAPHTWALLSPALTLTAAALTILRLQGTGELLALGTLGVSRRQILASSLWATVPLGALAAAIGRATEPSVEVARAHGAWLVHGVLRLDPGVLALSPFDLSRVHWGAPLNWPGTAALLVLGGLAGGVLGANNGRRSVLVAASTLVIVDLVRRGSGPAAGSALLVAVAASVAALSRWSTARSSGATRSPARR